MIIHTLKNFSMGNFPPFRNMVHTMTKTTHYNFYGPMQKGRNEHINRLQSLNEFTAMRSIETRLGLETVILIWILCLGYGVLVVRLWVHLDHDRPRTCLVPVLCYKNLAIANRSRVSCIQYVEDIHRPKYYTVTLKSRLRVTQGHWKRNHWTDHTRLTISRV